MHLFLGVSIKICAQVTWTQKDNMPVYRTQAMAFSIGTKGYVVCGLDQNIIGSTDLWEWDQATEIWTQMANLPGDSRISGVGFSIGNKGYVAIGYEFGFYDELWEWDQATDTWTQKSSLPAAPRGQSAVFTIGTKAYIAGGFDKDYNYLEEFWEWDQATDNWIQKENLPEQLSSSTGFSIGTKGYIVSGNANTGRSNRLWEWDQTNDTWTPKASLAIPRAGAISYSVGNKGYIASGEGISYLNDLWEWDQITDTWTQKSDLPASPRARSCSFSINNKGYILGGETGPFGNLNEMWELESIVTTEIKDEIKLVDQVKVFPNPCKSFFYIQFDQEPDKVDLTITDILGRPVDLQQINLSNFNNVQLINIDQLLSGVYILNIQTEIGNYAEKLKIQK